MSVCLSEAVCLSYQTRSLFSHIERGHGHLRCHGADPDRDAASSEEAAACGGRSPPASYNRRLYLRRRMIVMLSFFIQSMMDKGRVGNIQIQILLMPLTRVSSCLWRLNNASTLEEVMSVQWASFYQAHKENAIDRIYDRRNFRAKMVETSKSLQLWWLRVSSKVCCFCSAELERQNEGISCPMRVIAAWYLYSSKRSTRGSGSRCSFSAKVSCQQLCRGVVERHATGLVYIFVIQACSSEAFLPVSHWSFSSSTPVGFVVLQNQQRCHRDFTFSHFPTLQLLKPIRICFFKIIAAS